MNKQLFVFKIYIKTNADDENIDKINKKQKKKQKRKVHDEWRYEKLIIVKKLRWLFLGWLTTQEEKKRKEKKNNKKKKDKEINWV